MEHTLRELNQSIQKIRLQLDLRFDEPPLPTVRNASTPHLRLACITADVEIKRKTLARLQKELARKQAASSTASAAKRTRGLTVSTPALVDTVASHASSAAVLRTVAMEESRSAGRQKRAPQETTLSSAAKRTRGSTVSAPAVFDTVASHASSAGLAPTVGSSSSSSVTFFKAPAASSHRTPAPSMVMTGGISTEEGG